MDKANVKITNRTRGRVFYKIHDKGIKRIFESGETKVVPLEELKALQWVPGGERLLKNSFIINDKSALEQLNMQVEPEYFYTEKEIEELLLNGSLDQLEDTLNFAPEGVIGLIKKIAVDLEIPDVRKRDMITKKTGFGVSNAIRVKDMAKEAETAEEQTSASTDGPVRKAAPVEVEAPKRKIVIIDKN